MISQPLANATRRLGAPQTWDHAADGLCHTLEVFDHDGWMISAWRPTNIELERLKRGASLFLFIQGTIHPVVSLEVQE